jgi:exonuclease SbcC
MKLKALRFGGIGRFRDDVDVPIAALGDAALVAVVGDNGAGKTTFLELLPASVYRWTPSRGPVAGMANRRDSYIEAVVELLGHDYTMRQLINGVARRPTTEAYLTRDGEQIATGKVRDFDALVAEHFSGRDIYFASGFAAQNGEGRFLEIPPARRKDLFAELLTCGRLQVMSDAAGEHSRGVDSRIHGLRGHLEALDAWAAEIPDCETKLAANERILADAASRRDAIEHEAQQAVEALEAWHSRRTALAEDLSDAKAALERASRAAGEHRRREDQLGEDLATKTARRARLEERVAQRDALERQVTDAAGIEASITAAKDELETLRACQEDHRTAAAAWRQRLTDAQALARETAQARDAAHAQTKAELAQAKKDLQQFEQQAAGLSRVPCGGSGEYSTCPLIAGATAARERLEALRYLVEKLTDAVDGDPPGTDEADAALAVLEKIRAEEPTEPSDPNEVQEVEQRIEALQARAAGAATARALLDETRQQSDEAARLDREVSATRTDLAAVRKLLPDLGQAEHNAVNARRTRETALSEHDAAKPAAASEDALRAAREVEREAEIAVQFERTRLGKLREAAASVDARRAELDEALTDLDDWKHLQTALGRNGIQALEIDAAGPEVSELTNELLHACYGTRFSVSLETSALKADGKGTKEIFDLHVIDTERGTDGSADLLSGGEKVLISEALSLAIAIYNARRSSIPIDDLVRDECAGALSSVNATRYIEMLRRAVDLGGFHRCYFVAHQPHLWDLADARLLVDAGTVTIADANEIVVRPAMEGAAA